MLEGSVFYDNGLSVTDNMSTLEGYSNSSTDNRIFNGDNAMSTNGSMLTFKDCPNKCTDGRIFDPYLHKWKICEHCQEKRKKLVFSGVKDTTTGQDIKEYLNLPESFIGVEFKREAVIPEAYTKYLIESSITSLLDELTGMLNSISVGDLPKQSYMINFGRKSFPNNFIYPLLVRGYISGLDVAPMLTSYDITVKRQKAEQGIREDNLPFDELLKKDLCVIVLDSGSTVTSINAVRGFMQLRANNHKPTIIITNIWNRYVHSLTNESGILDYASAKLLGVEYKSEQEEDSVNDANPKPQSNSLTGSRGSMSQESFNALFKPTKSM